jgi:asparaginyl-tRNA synthetase
VLCINEIRVVHTPLSEEHSCIDSIIDLPRDPIEYTRYYYKYVKHPSVLRSIITYSSILGYMRKYLVEKGFIELPSPIIGHVSDPGLRGARKAVIELYGGLFEVQSSLIMYKQLYASILERVFYTARNLRLEPVENAYTGRHLVEFTQIDVEEASSNPEEAMRLGERALYYVVKKILNEYSYLFKPSELERVEKEIIKPPYPRIKYDEALEELSKLGYRVKKGEELPFEVEAKLADKLGTPVWITEFPVKARGFYYLENPEKPGYNLDYNLILPSGHGEVLDGGCREYRYERLVEKINSIHGEPPGKYQWFLELARSGEIRPTCGWGIGVERLVKYLLNLDHIAYATPHPRIPGVVGP